MANDVLPAIDIHETMNIRENEHSEYKWPQ